MLGKLRTGIKMAGLRFIHRGDTRRRNRLPFDGRLSPDHWGHTVDADGILCIQGIPVTELAEAYGTPLHIVDCQQLEANYANFYNAFAEHYADVTIGLSYKTNPVPGVLSRLSEAGAWSEVISHFELWLALRLDVPPEKIIFNGPGKTQDGLRLAVEKSIYMINIDGFDELEQLEEIARSLGQRQRVGIRIVTSTGWGGQFGFRLSNGSAYAALEKLASSEYLVPCGIHMHLGTGIRSVDGYLTAIEEMLDFAADAQRRLGITVDVLDIGGGFGVATVREYDVTDDRLLLSGFPARLHDVGSYPGIEVYGRSAMSLVTRKLKDWGTSPKIVLEPGRAVTSSAQCLLVSVLAVKAREHNSLGYITDAGKNLTMPLGYEFHEILPANKMTANPSDERANLYGPLCHPGDVLARYRRLPELGTGDLLSVMDSGSYFIPNQMNFSTPRAAVAWVDNGRHGLMRKREQFDDIIRSDVFELD